MIPPFMFATGIENSYPTIHGGRAPRRRDGEVRPLRALARRTSTASRSWASTSCATGRRCTAPGSGRAATTGSSPTSPSPTCGAATSCRSSTCATSACPTGSATSRTPTSRRLFADYARAFAERFPWVQLYTPVNEMFICATFSARVRLVERAAARPTARSSPRSSTSSRRTCWRCRRSSRCGPTRSSSRASRREYFHADSPAAIKPAEIAERRSASCRSTSTTAAASTRRCTST